MCGIFGFDRQTENTKKLTPALAMAIEQRGHDSWGCTDGEAIYKYLGSISKTFVDHSKDLWKGPVVYHTRAASCGAVSVRNAHPFKFVDKKTVVGVHNGVLTNNYQLKNKYKRASLEVDSENIFMHLAEEKNLGEIEGYGVVVWWEHANGVPADRQIFLSRFSHEALHVAKLDTAEGEYVFASTEDAISNACRYAGIKIKTFYETKPLERYTFLDGKFLHYDTLNWEAAPLKYERAEWVGYGNRNDSSGYGGSYAGMNNVSRSSRRGICNSKRCNRIVKGPQFVCDACMDDLIKEYDTASA